MALHALIIGLDEALDRHLQPLRYGCADARAIHVLLADEFGHGEKVRLLLHPNLSAVRKTLSEIEGAVRGGDTFLLYFAGHGAQHGDEQFMLLHEASLAELERGDVVGNDLLALGGLMRRVADWPAVQAAYVLDACRTPLRRGARTGTYSAEVQALLDGLVARGDFRMRRDRPGSDDRPDANPARRPLVLNACADGEQAFELEALGRGQFSHAFEQWMRAGKAQGLPRVLGREAVDQIADLVDGAARQNRGRRGQRPWLPVSCDDVLLWRPAQANVGSAATNLAASVVIGAPAEDLSALLLRFEQQLATARWRAPAWDCCMGTLALLHRAGLSEAALRVYQQMVEQAETTQLAGPVFTGPATPLQPLLLPSMPAGHLFQDAPWAPKMVVIPPGRFMMGSPDNEPGRRPNEGLQREVEIRQAFGMGRCVVTFDDYDRYAKDANLALPFDPGWSRGDRPVINVSWDDTQKYIVWLNHQLGLQSDRGYRLPTEAEWEYAARAGTSTPYWWGSAITPGQANYNGNDVYAGGGQKGEWRAMTVKADAFEANAWGLYNVHGNVWEWVQDCWHGSYAGAPQSGEEWNVGCEEANRVVRGGSWGVKPCFLRSANRSRGAPDARGDYGGFRVARTF